MTTETERIEEARRAYSRGRFKLAATGALAALALTLLALLMGSNEKALWFGAALLIVATASLYFGRAPGRAVLPAFVLGLIPFSALLIVHAVGSHSCHAGGCAPLCLPTCGVSGLVAGGLLAIIAIRSRASLGFIAAAAPMVWLVGALGCPCVGMASVLGMALGITLPALSVLPALNKAGA